MSVNDELFGDPELNSFKSIPQTRALNDSENKKRELVVRTLVNADQSKRDQLRRAITNKDFFDSLCSAMDIALDELATLHPEVETFSAVSAVARGGRQYKHDLDIIFETTTSKTVVPVEFKRTGRVCEQPQFWQPTVRSTGILRSDVPNYAEYFYDNYFAELQLLSGCDFAARDHYLSKVFGTTYLEVPFSQLKAFVRLNQSKMKKLHIKSRDAYVRFLLSIDEGGLDFPELQKLLFQQLSKWFISWDPSGRRFVWERLKPVELTLTRTVSGTVTRSGEYKGIALPTLSGQTVSFLQVWRNNPCVKMPAWQVSLSCP